MKSRKVPENIDEYIAGFPPAISQSLVKLRDTIKKAAPGAEEKISYQMPMFRQKGVLTYFGVHTNHIGFYPGTSTIQAFKEELAGYYTSTGTVQFPLGKPLPLKLISQMIKFKVLVNLENDLLKKNKKTR